MITCENKSLKNLNYLLICWGAALATGWRGSDSLGICGLAGGLCRCSWLALPVALLFAERAGARPRWIKTLSTKWILKIDQTTSIL